MGAKIIIQDPDLVGKILDFLGEERSGDREFYIEDPIQIEKISSLIYRGHGRKISLNYFKDFLREESTKSKYLITLKEDKSIKEKFENSKTIQECLDSVQFKKKGANSKEILESLWSSIKNFSPDIAKEVLDFLSLQDNLITSDRIKKCGFNEILFSEDLLDFSSVSDAARTALNDLFEIMISEKVNTRGVGKGETLLVVFGSNGIKLSGSMRDPEGNKKTNVPDVGIGPRGNNDLSETTIEVKDVISASAIGDSLGILFSGHTKKFLESIGVSKEELEFFKAKDSGNYIISSSILNNNGGWGKKDTTENKNILLARKINDSGEEKTRSSFRKFLEDTYGKVKQGKQSMSSEDMELVSDLFCDIYFKKNSRGVSQLVSSGASKPEIEDVLKKEYYRFVESFCNIVYKYYKDHNKFTYLAAVGVRKENRMGISFFDDELFSTGPNSFNVLAIHNWNTSDSSTSAKQGSIGIKSR